MSEMVKYPSIENSYQKKHIEMWLRARPELINERFIVTEKIHGSNFQVLFTPEQECRYFSRNQEILLDEKFHDYQNALIEPLLQDAFEALQAYANINNKSVRAFGELFGKGIMKGVDYGFGTEKRFRIFDIVIGERWLAPLEALSAWRSVSNLWVPSVGVMSLQEALDIDVEQTSMFNPVEGNTWEGIVIKPYSKIYRSPQGSMFFLKKKSEKFKEKSHAPAPRAVDSEVEEVNILFSGYFNDNRVQSCFSKMGEIQEPKQMAEYIKAILEDGKADFIKDHGEKFEKLSKEQQRKALNLGGTIVNLLKPYL